MKQVSHQATVDAKQYFVLRTVSCQLHYEHVNYNRMYSVEQLTDLPFPSFLTKQNLRASFSYMC